MNSKKLKFYKKRNIKMKKLIQLSALAAALGFSGTALACDSDIQDEWECLINTSDPTVNLIDEGKQGPFTFTGITDLTVGPLIRASCTLSLEGWVEMQSEAESGIEGGITYIKVTGGEVIGGGTCASLTLGGFPWHAERSGNIGMPGANGGDVFPKYTGSASANMSGIKVSHSIFGSICDGTMPNVSYQNGAQLGDPSSFNFNGSIPGATVLGACSVVGKLLADGADIDAW